MVRFISDKPFWLGLYVVFFDVGRESTVFCVGLILVVGFEFRAVTI